MDNKNEGTFDNGGDKALLPALEPYFWLWIGEAESASKKLTGYIFTVSGVEKFFGEVDMYIVISHLI